jgi:hypothetical protein
MFMVALDKPCGVLVDYPVGLSSASTVRLRRRRWLRKASSDGKKRFTLGSGWAATGTFFSDRKLSGLLNFRNAVRQHTSKVDRHVNVCRVELFFYSQIHRQPNQKLCHQLLKK